MLEAAGPDYANVVVFQSLSKRSNLPGLRVGFAAGDRRFLARFLELRNVAAPQVPCRRSESRSPPTATRRMSKRTGELYAAKFDLADQIIGDRYGYRRPAGGFFLWLDVSAQGGDEAVALRLGAKPGCASFPAAIWRASRRTAQSRPRLHPRRHGARQGDHRRGAAPPRRGAGLRNVHVRDRPRPRP